MKRLASLVLLGVIAIASSYAQVPQGINYQAVARDANGLPLDGVNGDVEISIIDTIGGTVIYSEMHNVTTNQFGLFTLVIGKGNPLTSNLFGSIQWGIGGKFLQVKADFGNGFEDMGITKLYAVPYALYAKNAGNGQPGKNSVISTTQLAIGDMNCPLGGLQINYGIDQNGNNQLDASEITGTDYLCNSVSAGGLDTAYVSGDTLYISDLSGNTVSTALPSAASDSDWTVLSSGNLTTYIPGQRVGIGTPPLSQFDVANFTNDTVVASFSGTNSFATAIAVRSIDLNASSNILFLSSTDTAIVGVDPLQNMAYFDNMTPGGSTSIGAEQNVYLNPDNNLSVDAVATYIASDTIYSLPQNNTKTLFINDGTFKTDSLYVFGSNATQFGWVLTSNGQGKAMWTDPASLNTGFWQANNGSDIFNTNIGNVGIGTTLPLFPLHVETNTLNRVGYFINNTTSTANKFGVYAGTSGGGSGDNIGGWFDAGGGTGVNYGVAGQALGTGENRAVYGSAINGTTNWAGYFESGNVYIQNTLVLPTDAGQGKVLTSDVSGNASWKTRQIAFEAALSNDTLVGTSSSISIPFDNVAINDGGGYSNSLFLFQAPVSGVYDLNVNLNIENASTLYGSQIVISFIKNGTTIKTLTQTIAANTTENVSFGITIVLNSTETVEIEIKETGPNMVSRILAIGSWFSGHLVYAY